MRSLACVAMAAQAAIATTTRVFFITDLHLRYVASAVRRTWWSGQSRTPRTMSSKKTARGVGVLTLVELGAAGRDRPGLALLDEPRVLGVVQINDVEPDLQHVVHAALAESGPHVRIRIAAVGRRVVVDADQVEHRPRRKQRRRIVGIHIVDVP